MVPAAKKMSLQGIKQEFRQTEGDPTIKANARALHATVEIDGKYRRSTTAPSPKSIGYVMRLRRMAGASRLL